MIGGRRPIKGRKPADRRVRVDRPHAPYFRYTGPGPAGREAGGVGAARRPAGGPSPRAKEMADRPPARERRGDRASGCPSARRCRSSARTRSRPPPTRPRRSCGSSSLAGAARAASRRSRSRSRSPSCWPWSRSPTARSATPIPGGGGAYAVAQPNLAPIVGLVAAGALLIDYVMTVAVSTSSAMDQLISIVPGLELWRLPVAHRGDRILITVGNLRGLRESGNIFASPPTCSSGSALLDDRERLSHIVGGTVVPMPRQPEARADAAPRPWPSCCCCGRSPAARSP